MWQVFGLLYEYGSVTEHTKYNPDGSIKKDPKYPARDLGAPNRYEPACTYHILLKKNYLIIYSFNFGYQFGMECE